MNKDGLKKKLEEKVMTIKGLCKLSGINSTTMWRKLNGETEFNRDEMERLSKALNLTREEMLDIFFEKEVA